MPKYKAPENFEGDRIYIGGGCWNLDADRCITTEHGDYSIPLAGWTEVHDNPQAEHDAAQAAAADAKPDDAAPQGDAPQS